MLDLALLGSGGSMPMPDRFLSSLLIRYKGRKILIDCGEGTQVAMRILKWGFKSIDIICITHKHGDHILGLPGLLATIGNSGRTEPILIIGPNGIAKIIEGLILSVPYLPYDIKLIEVSNSSTMVNFSSEGIKIEEAYNNYSSNGDLIISTFELDHSAPCIGYSLYIPRSPKFNPEKAIFYNIPKNLWRNLQRGETITYEGNIIEPHMVLEGNRKGIKLSYITDTRPISIIPDFIKESDLFICEGTYGDSEDIGKAIENKHMTFYEAAQLAYEGKVTELLLTHFSPAMDKPEVYIENAAKIFPNTIIGYDGYIKTLTYS